MMNSKVVVSSTLYIEVAKATFLLPKRHTWTRRYCAIMDNDELVIAKSKFDLTMPTKSCIRFDLRKARGYKTCRSSNLTSAVGLSKNDDYGKPWIEIIDPFGKKIRMNLTNDDELKYWIDPLDRIFGKNYDKRPENGFRPTTIIDSSRDRHADCLNRDRKWEELVAFERKTQATIKMLQEEEEDCKRFLTEERNRRKKNETSRENYENVKRTNGNDEQMYRVRLISSNDNVCNEKWSNFGLLTDWSEVHKLTQDFQSDCPQTIRVSSGASGESGIGSSCQEKETVDSIIHSPSSNFVPSLENQLSIDIQPTVVVNLTNDDNGHEAARINDTVDEAYCGTKRLVAARQTFSSPPLSPYVQPLYYGAKFKAPLYPLPFTKLEQPAVKVTDSVSVDKSKSNRSVSYDNVAHFTTDNSYNHSTLADCRKSYISSTLKDEKDKSMNVSSLKTGAVQMLVAALEKRNVEKKYYGFCDIDKNEPGYLTNCQSIDSNLNSIQKSSHVYEEVDSVGKTLNSYQIDNNERCQIFDNCDYELPISRYCRRRGGGGACESINVNGSRENALNIDSNRPLVCSRCKIDLTLNELSQNGVSPSSMLNWSKVNGATTAKNNSTSSNCHVSGPPTHPGAIKPVSKFFAQKQRVPFESHNLSTPSLNWSFGQQDMPPCKVVFTVKNTPLCSYAKIADLPTVKRDTTTIMTSPSAEGNNNNMGRNASVSYVFMPNEIACKLCRCRLGRREINNGGITTHAYF